MKYILLSFTQKKSSGKKEIEFVMTYWPHGPLHRFEESGTYMITAGTYYKRHLFKDSFRLNFCMNLFFEMCENFNIHPQAWAFLSNHYHFIVALPDGSGELHPFIKAFHRKSAIELNKLDNQPGRKVWYQFWDKHISFRESYYPRLKYIHNNPVHHKIVENPEEYFWCSAAWFNTRSDRVFKRTIESFKTDKLNVFDNF